MPEEQCRKEQCGYSQVGYQGKLYCRLSHAFIEELGRFCPKDLDIEKIKENCDYYVPPEGTDDGKSCCLAHVAEDWTSACWIKEWDDLLRDPDFTLKKEAR